MEFKKTKIVIPMRILHFKEWHRFKASLGSLPFDVLEWRIDILKENQPAMFESVIRDFQTTFPEKELMVTYRTEKREVDEEEKEQREEVYTYLLTQPLDYIDIEYSFIAEHLPLWGEWPKEHLLVSTHLYGEKAKQRVAIGSELLELEPKQIKMAVDPLGLSQDTDWLLLEQERWTQAEIPFSLMVMQDCGKWSRALAPELEEQFVYASVGSCCREEGQFTANEMKQIEEELWQRRKKSKKQTQCDN